MNVKVIENTADTQHLVLAVSPTNAGDVAMDELERVAGGALGITGDVCL